MTLVPGTRLGAYEIVRPIGAGGMGEVHRALDTTLKREVAIKVLPTALADDPERLARFRREAEVLASLNHPNIAQIYGVVDGGSASADAAGHPRNRTRDSAVHALVMELVDGPTLADRIAQGAIAFEEALPIARQIAEALEAAHDRGIVHRDLKPANIKVRDDGAVKVLDFGLAKAMERSSDARLPAATVTASPTLTSPLLVGRGGETGLTGVGMLLGTAAYMSPEQARGRPADRRSDIWAFGVVLFEMLAGRRPFERPPGSRSPRAVGGAQQGRELVEGQTSADNDGDQIADTLASILKSEPAWDALPDGTPAAVRRLLRRCLEKDPRRRLQHIGDARLEIEETAAADRDAVETPARHGRPAGAWIGALGAAALAGAAISALVLWRTGSPETPPLVNRVTVPVTPAKEVARALKFPNARPFGAAIALSPDGRTLVFVGERPDGRDDSVAATASVQIDAVPDRQLYVRALEKLEATPIPGTEGAESPFFSPDGQWIGFWQTEGGGDGPGDLKKVSVAGGPVQRIARIPMPGGISWAPDGRIVYATYRAGGLWQVPDNGGIPQPVTMVDPAAGELHHRLPHVLPGGDAVLFTVQTATGGWDDARVVVRSLVNGEQKTIAENAADARYLRDGYVIFARMGALFAQRFDLARLEVSGTAVAVAEDVMQDVNSRFAIGNSGAAQFTLSAAGMLAYLAGGVSPPGSYVPVWVDRETGASQEIGVPHRVDAGRPRVSPEGKRIAFQTGNGIGIFDIERGIYNQLTPPELAGPELGVVLRVTAWHPHGERIAFTGRDNRLYWIAADGSSGAEALTDAAPASASGRRVQLANSWSPDGNTLAFIQRDETSESSSSDIWLLSFVNGRPAGARRFRETPFDEVAVEFSPDGRYLSYQVDEGRQAQVFVEPYPGPGRREPVSSDSGLQPLWRRDSRELFYLGRPGDRLSMMSVDVPAGERFTPSRPKELWSGRADQYPTGLRGRVYDVMPDGKRFVMIQQRDDFSQPPITNIVLVQNFLEELKRLLPAR